MPQYVAAYDIQDDVNRQQVADLLWRYGNRIQKSVFIVELNPQDLQSLQAELGPYLSEADLMDLIPVDGSTNRPHWRWQADLEHLQAVIVFA